MCSINNKNWLEKEVQNNLVDYIMVHYNISYITAKILLNRGINIENLENFFNGKLKNSMPSPYIIKDMETAVTITTEIIKNKQNICIMGDYDVDGMCSIALLFKYLKSLELSPGYYIPNRFTDGYGGSINSLDSILKHNPNLIIMVDNGSSSYELVEELIAKNKYVIIIDHHAIEPNMPKAQAIVNPARLDDDSELNYLCSAGLVFLFIVALHRELINCNFLSKNTSNMQLLALLDLVALATVCDMVPLKKLNRVFIKQGIKVLSQKEHIGLKSLLEVLNFDGKITFDTLGFTLGPAINAASRMGKEELALKLLITDNEKEALNLAISLKDSNTKRQEEEDIIIKKAAEQIVIKDHDNKFIFLGSDKWSQGIVGIIAGRIKELHNKPTCIYSINTNTNIATASGRSVNNIDLGNIVIAARQNGLLVKGGGHSQAVGFSFNLSLKEKIFEFFNKNIQLQTKRKQIDNNLFIDHSLALTAVNKELIHQLELLEPFGTSFEEPLFKITSVFINNVKVIGKNRNHLTFDISDGIRKAKGICFKAIPSSMGDYILNMSKKPVDIIAKVKGYFYKGNIYPNLIVVDLKLS